MIHYQVLGQDQQPGQPIAVPSSIEIQPATPIQLEIPKIGVNALIEPVGLDSDGKMGVPELGENIGWYNLGPNPGERGNAVLDGHLDTINGSPAVFYDLNKLELGDLITVTDANNKKFIFKVIDKKTYEFNLFPLNDIFGDSAIPRLNLITCEGYFDNRMQNYTHRTVIFSELVEQI